ncbi:MAG: sugar transferase [Deltaproteobacteria bacterium]|nr:sugar transferase [Deltaproteobacteria bacterium]
MNRITSRGPAFYSQTRVGKDGKSFQILKLRTMVEGAERTTGAVLSWSGDPRVTTLGALLRKTHLDELPQLLNIARGEMGFIGPRPERPEFVSQFRREVPNYSLRLSVKPGVTGLAQICCPYDVSVHEKLHYDLIYLVNRGSLRLSFFILSRTLLKVAQLD